MKCLPLLALLAWSPQIVPNTVVEIETEEQTYTTPNYEKEDNKQLNKLIKNFIDQYPETGSVYFKDFEGENLGYHQRDTYFQFSVGIAGDSLFLRGPKNVESLKIKYEVNNVGKTADGEDIFITSTAKLNPKGPLKNPLINLVEAIIVQIRDLRLREGEPPVYRERIDSPQFHKACTTISEYVRTN